MEVFCPVDAMEFPCFSGICTFIRKNRIGRLEEWKIPFHATLNPLERENGSGIGGFHWDFDRSRYGNSIGSLSYSLYTRLLARWVSDVRAKRSGQIGDLMIVD
jgi:hypothetical protein